MKKILSICVLFFLCVFPFFSVDSGKADVVVLLDTSGTMLPSFEAVSDQVLTDIATNFIRLGDTFHLISFSDNSSVEIAQQIRTESDVQNIVSRFRLLYPLGVYSDFLSALKYTQRYISSLDGDSMRILVMVTDGICNPPKWSPYYAYTLTQIENEIAAVTSKLRRDGVSVYYIKAPFDSGVHITDLNGATAASGTSGNGSKPASQGGTALQPKPSSEAQREALSGSGSNSPSSSDSPSSSAEQSVLNLSGLIEKAPSVTTVPLPENFDTDSPSVSDMLFLLPELRGRTELGKQPYSFTLPLYMTGNSDKKVKYQLDSILIDGINVLDETVFVQTVPDKETAFAARITIPSTYEPGVHTLSAEFVFSGNVRVEPQVLTFNVELRKGFSFGGFLKAAAPFIYGILLILAAILLIAALIVFISRSTSRPHVKAFLDATAPEHGGMAGSGNVSAAPVLPASQRSSSDRSGRQTLRSDSAAPARNDGTHISAKSPESAPTQVRAPAASVQQNGSVKQTERLAQTPQSTPEETRSVQPAPLRAAAGSGEKPPYPAGGTAKTSSNEGSAGAASILNVRAAVPGVTQAAEPAQATRETGETERTAAFERVRERVQEEKSSAEKLSLFGSRVCADEQVQSSILPSIKDVETKDRVPAEQTERASLLTGAAARRSASERRIPAIRIASFERSQERTGRSYTMLDLFVANQNTQIGRRNVHLLKPGSAMTLGGGHSDFLVFLVKFPPRIAEVRWNGSDCSLEILKSEYFPYEESKHIENCIGRVFTLRSDKGYEVDFMLREYEDPVVKLNKLLLSVKPERLEPADHD